MMGHKGKLISGDEYDILTRWRKYISPRAPTKFIKSKYNRRMRRLARAQILEERNGH